MEYLIKDQANLASIYKTIDLIFWSFDISTKKAYYSKAVHQVYGYSPEEFYNNYKLWKQSAHPDDQQIIKRYEQQLVESKQNSSCEFRIIRSNQEVRWVEIHGSPIFDEKGQVIRLTGVINDISERKKAEKLYSELEKSHQELQSIYNSVDASIWSNDLINQTMTVSSGIEKISGYTVEEFSNNYTLWFELTHSEDVDLAKNFLQTLSSGKTATVVLRMITRDEKLIWIQMNGAPIFDSSGNVIKVNGIVTDITMLKKAENDIVNSREWFSTTLQSIGDGVIATDTYGKIVYINPIAETLIGWKSTEVIGEKMNDVFHIIHEKTRETVDNPIDIVLKENKIVGLAADTLLINRDDSEVPIDDSASPIRDVEGNMIGAVMVFRDVIERKRYEEEIKHYAFHDSLTGLPNRRLFTDRLTMAIAHAKRNNHTLALMFLDIDDFKLINDSLGHDKGDLFLKEISVRLSQAVRECDTVSRLGGDEFTIIIDNTSEEEVKILAKKILKELAEEFVVNDQCLLASCSIGICMFQGKVDNIDSTEFLINADIAMYHSKLSGKNNFMLFDSQMDEDALRKLELVKGLREAEENNEFRLHFQSKINVNTLKISGAEALLRWEHPKYGNVTPGEFIPLAEETGLIVPIGEYVLHEACMQCKHWHDDGADHLRIAVNISLKQFQQPDFINTIKHVLEKTKLDPQFLELEITESIMYVGEHIIDIFTELKHLGIVISLDDFGKGYSSLVYLKRLPISTLKIDKEFIRDLSNGPIDSEIITTIISLARSLNLNVIAEGVETEEQLEFIKKHECDEVQGFLFSKPLSNIEFHHKYIANC